MKRTDLSRDGKDWLSLVGSIGPTCTVLNMKVENWFSLVSAIAAVAAVVVAIWQAQIAVSARTDAEAAAAAAAVSERSALDAAERSAEAHARSADALERANSDKDQAKRKAHADRLMKWAVEIRDEVEGGGEPKTRRSIMGQTKKLYGDSLQFQDPAAMDLYKFVDRRRRAMKDTPPADIHGVGVAFLEELAERSARWVHGGQ